MEAIIVAIITGSISLIGTVLTILSTSRKTDESLRISQAVTDAKIEELTREVREHNGFARRLPVVEERIDVINRKIEKLEREDDRK